MAGTASVAGLGAGQDRPVNRSEEPARHQGIEGGNDGNGSANRPAVDEMLCIAGHDGDIDPDERGDT